MLKPVHLLIAFLIIIFIGLTTPGVYAGTIFQQGSASYYGKAHHGKRTASGERFNMHGLTAAHRTLPFGTKLLVTSKDTGKSILVTVNDRGPYHGRRILDLSQEAARQLGMIKLGVGQVTVERIGKKEVPLPRQLVEESPLHPEVASQLDSIGDLLVRLNL